MAFPDNPNTNALSLIFNPTDRPHPTTLSHLLTLPPLIYPVSPALAALQLARIRLQLSIPAGSLETTGWCTVCGDLRASTPNPKKRKCSRGGKQPARSPGQGFGPILLYEEDQTKAEPKSKSKGRPSNCEQCGAKFGRGKGKGSVVHDVWPAPSARKVRACRRQQPSQGEASPAKPLVTGTDQAMARDPLDQVPHIPSPSSLPLPESTSSPAHPAPRPPRYTSTPSLSHVLTSNPNPPTYPQPPPRLSSPGSTGGAGGAKSGKGKKKKSGLAKLLAENKEREVGRSGGSGWGLD